MAWPDPRAVRAAASNASWCATVCRARGIPGTLAVGQWRAATPPPAFYPDTITLVPGLAPGEVAAAVPERPGASVKDSFADVDLRAEGFELLLEAQWIWHEAAGVAAGVPAASEAERAAQAKGAQLEWDQVRTPDELNAWAAGSGQLDTFAPALLDDDSTRFLVARLDSVEVGRAALCLAAGVVAVSNVWAGAPSIWETLVPAVERLFPGRPVAGYESGPDLAAALAGGFEAVGPLRVWTRAA